MASNAARRALRGINSLVLPQSGDRPELMLSTFPFSNAAPVILDVAGPAFTVKRYVDRDEIEAMRDWLTAALAAIDTQDEAPVAAERLVA
jgi:hypothetical protein